MEVRGQEGLQKSQSRTRPRGHGEGLGPVCLEMPGLVRAELRQERPPLCPGPLRPVLGPPPPAASPQALSPEFTRNPAILRPLCQEGRLLRGSPSWPRPALHHVHALLSHTTRLYSQGHSGTLRDPHEAQRPSARPRSARLPSPRLSRQRLSVGGRPCIFSAAAPASGRGGRRHCQELLLCSPLAAVPLLLVQPLLPDGLF